MFSNPVLRRFSNVAAYIIFWCLITTINFIVFLAGFKQDIVYAATDSIVFNSVLALFALSFWYPVKYIPVERNSSYKLVFSHIFASIIASVVWISISFFLLINIFEVQQYQEFLINSLGWRFLSGLIFYLFIISIYYVIINYSELQDKINNESELKNLITLAELKTLKFQINPHFIFNSLNSLSSLTLTDPEGARRMTFKLAEFLRYSLANNERQRNKLSEEINNLRLYLEIERVRFEEKFRYIEDIQDECLMLEVPNMILQPIIENSIKHSVYEALGEIEIKLKCRIINETLVIKISNNYEKGTSSVKGEGVGLNNIAKRLELTYGQKGLLEVKDEQGIFSVKIIIPPGKEKINAV